MDFFDELILAFLGGNQAEKSSLYSRLLKSKHGRGGFWLKCVTSTAAKLYKPGNEDLYGFDGENPR
jgi:hypothetical protein